MFPHRGAGVRLFHERVIHIDGFVHDGLTAKCVWRAGVLEEMDDRAMT